MNYFITTGKNIFFIDLISNSLEPEFPNIFSTIIIINSKSSLFNKIVSYTSLKKLNVN